MYGKLCGEPVLAPIKELASLSVRNRRAACTVRAYLKACLEEVSRTSLSEGEEG